MTAKKEVFIQFIHAKTFSSPLLHPRPEFTELTERQIVKFFQMRIKDQKKSDAALLFKIPHKAADGFEFKGLTFYS